MKLLKISASLVLGSVFVLAAAAMPRQEVAGKAGKKPGIVICFPAPPSCYGCHNAPPYPCQEDQ